MGNNKKQNWTKTVFVAPGRRKRVWRAVRERGSAASPPTRLFLWYSKLGQRRDTPVSRALSAGPARSKSITVVDIAYSFFFSFFPSPLSFGVHLRLRDRLSAVVKDGQMRRRKTKTATLGLRDNRTRRTTTENIRYENNTTAVLPPSIRIRYDDRRLIQGDGDRPENLSVKPGVSNSNGDQKYRIEH